MAQTNTLENDMPEVFTKTVEQVGLETCDKCGSTVKAAYTANKGDTSLYFCGHHIRRFADRLKEQGFGITPEDISYEAGSKPATTEAPV